MPTDESIARGVTAIIVFHDAITGERLCEVDGRWADSTQAAHRDQNIDIGNILGVDFKIGQRRSLDLVFKYPGDAECYPFNNDSYGFPDFKNPAWAMRSRNIMATITLTAPFVRCRADVQIVNEGTDSDLTSPHWTIRDELATQRLLNRL